MSFKHRVRKLLMSFLVVLSVAGVSGCNSSNNQSATPQFKTIIEGGDLSATEEIRRLIMAGADVNVRARGDNGTMLLMASHQGKAEVVAMLLKAGADVNSVGLPYAGDNVSKTGAKALFIAVANGHAEVVELLLEAGADGDEVSPNTGATPLFVAMKQGHTEVVQALLDGKVDMNFTMANGTTPLYMASVFGNAEYVRMLLKAGADVNQATASGVTPLAVALQESQMHREHRDVVKILREYGAR